MTTGNQPTESKALARTEQANLAQLGTMAEQAARETVAVASAQARVLAEIIENRHLYTKIGDGKHVEIEGWELAATFRKLGVGVDKTEEIRDAAGELAGFKAHAVVRQIETGQVVSEAWHTCLLSEPKWKGKPLFSISSMAGTRASSKALRMCLSWVMVLGGYAPTPAEEMEGVQREDRQPAERRPPTEQEAPRGLCPVHKTPFVHKTGTTQKGPNAGKPYDFWGCPEKVEGGKFCQEKPAEAPASRPEGKQPVETTARTLGFEDPDPIRKPAVVDAGLHDGNWKPKGWQECYNAVEAQFRIGPTEAKRLADEAGEGATWETVWLFHWQRVHGAPTGKVG